MISRYFFFLTEHSHFSIHRTQFTWTRTTYIVTILKSGTKSRLLNLFIARVYRKISVIPVINYQTHISLFMKNPYDIAYDKLQCFSLESLQLYLKTDIVTNFSQIARIFLRIVSLAVYNSFQIQRGHSHEEGHKSREESIRDISRLKIDDFDGTDKSTGCKLPPRTNLINVTSAFTAWRGFEIDQSL